GACRAVPSVLSIFLWYDADGHRRDGGVALFEFIRVWGEYLFTLTMIDDRGKYTLGIGLVQQFASATIEFGEFTSYGGQSAAYIMGAAPAVIFFIVLQRWFVRGLLVGLKF